jgi:transposase
MPAIIVHCRGRGNVSPGSCALRRKTVPTPPLQFPVAQAQIHGVEDTLRGVPMHKAGPGDSDRRISGSLAPTNGCVSSHHRSKSMARRTRRNHTPAFKAQVALTALKSDKTLAELAQQDDIHPNQITDWKRPLTEHAVQVFGDARSPASSDPDLTKRHAKIGQWTLENDFLEHALTQAGLLSARRGLTATISSLYRISAPCLGWLVRACTTRHARSRRRTSR